MKLFKSKLFIGIICSVFIIAAVSIVIISTFGSSDEKTAFSITDAEKAKLRAHYPAFDSFPPNVSFSPDFKVTIEDVVEKLDLIIVGEVLESISDSKSDIDIEKGTPEAAIFDKQAKLGNDVKSNRVQTKIRVLEILKGQEQSREIIARQSRLFVNYEPKCTPGMKVLLMLTAGKNESEGIYGMTKFGFFFITDDNRVVPAISDEGFDRFTGMYLNDFKNEIKKMIK